MEDEALQKVCHLQIYQTKEAQIFLWTTAAVKASYGLTFHIFLSYQAEQTLILSSRWKEIATSGGAGGGEVMSSLPLGVPLGGISLIKMK